MSFVTINTKLYNILDLLDGAGGRLSVIYDYPEVQPSSYPAAYPIVVGAREVIDETNNNLLAMDFIIRVIFQDEHDSTTYSDMLTTIDELMAELRKDDHYTLDGTVHKFEQSGDVDFYRTGEAETALIVCDVHCTAEVQTATNL